LFDLSIDGMSISSGLDSVYEELAQYAKENSLPLHMLQLSRTILGYPNSWSFPAASLDMPKCYQNFLVKALFQQHLLLSIWHVLDHLFFALV
jgi:hypothetical protein